MEEYLPMIKKMALPLGLVIGLMLRGTKYDLSKIVLFGRKREKDDTDLKNGK